MVIESVNPLPPFEERVMGVRLTPKEPVFVTRVLDDREELFGWSWDVEIPGADNIPPQHITHWCSSPALPVSS